MLPIFLSLLTFAHAADSSLPFWKAKPKYYERIKNGEILVAVSEDRNQRTADQRVLRINGGGLVAAPRDKTFAIAQRFEEMPNHSDYIKSAVMKRETGELTLVLMAYGYSGTVRVMVKSVPGNSDTPSRLDYVLVSGPLDGLNGQLTFTPVSPKKTEVGLTGELKYREFPLPKIFLEFAAEVIFQRIAFRVRQYAEQEAQP